MNKMYAPSSESVVCLYKHKRDLTVLTRNWHGCRALSYKMFSLQSPKKVKKSGKLLKKLFVWLFHVPASGHRQNEGISPRYAQTESLNG